MTSKFRNNWESAEMYLYIYIGPVKSENKMKMSKAIHENV